MTTSSDQLAAALRASVKEAELLRLRNQALLEASSEPIAIVGMSCRYPGGVSSPRDLWNLVDAGIDAISGFPTDRGWDLERLYDPDPDNPGTCYVREGGFLSGVADFDPAFFGISPREALECDPQQRLLLEACWEALEDAAIVPASLRRSRAGVFAGVMYSDYGWGPSPMSDKVASPSTAAGSVLSGRIAYTLGLEGPAMTVDTACSSSLVTLHLAVQALRQGDCTLALAGGATVLSTPNPYVFMSRQRAFAPDGRSKSFAEAADGVGWSEGVGVLVLERLSDAERNGHPVLAMVRGSAVNQDGASNGLSAPNGPAQERVIRQALASAGLTPQDVDAVEAHGTGTPLGDPIEAGALLATYGQDREAPLKLGSIKSNIGHPQAAAGVAGVIKMVMAMREGALPKTLHIDAPSTKIDWSAGEIELLTEAAEWSPASRPRRAAVSSFGLSGTNAHVILEEAPATAPTPDGPGETAPPLPGSVPLLLSARSEPALRAQAARLATHLEDNPELDSTDVAYSLATTRTAFEHRAAALGSDREQLLGALDALAREGESPGVVGGVARGNPRPVFLFGGHGSQWQGMALELFDSSPAFAAHLRTCEEALSPHIDFSPLDILRREDGEWLQRVDLVQPTLFAVMVAVARLWQDLGITPAAVAGHSQGEVAAAHIAGGLSLEDAAHLAAVRGRMISSLTGRGRLVSVALSAAEVESRLEPWAGRIEIGAFNGPTSTILSGDEEAIEELLARLTGEGARAREIRGAVSPSHSAQVEVLRDEILGTFASLSPRSGEIPFHSTVTGGPLDTAGLDAEYWYRNLRQPVRLEQVIRGMLQDGHRLLVELSPHPVLGLAVTETIEDTLGEAGEAVFLGASRREDGGPERMALALAAAHAAGAEVDWPAFFAGTGAGRAPLPTYAFQRRRFWLEPSSGGEDLRASGLDSVGHPLLGAAVAVAEGDGGVLLTGRLSLATHRWLGDHVYEAALLPGTGFVELALRAGTEVGCEVLEEITLQAPLILPEEGAVAIQVSVSEPDGQGRRELAIHSRLDAEGEEWVRHATGSLSAQPLPPPEPIGAWPPEGAEPLEVAGAYDRLAERGLLYGPAFQCLETAWRRGEELFAEVSLPEELGEEAQRFGLHPALLDASGHAGFDLAVKDARGEPGPGGLALPFAWRGVRHYASGASSMRVRVSPVDGGHSIVACDEAGALVAAIDSVVLRAAEPGRLRDAAERRSLYAVEWSASGSEPEGSEQRLAILGDEPIEGVEAERYPDLAALLEALEGGAEVPGSVLIASRAEEEEGEDLLGATHRATRRAQALVRAWASLEPLGDSRLVFLTEGAVAIEEGERPSLAIAPILGLVRSARSEYPGRFATIDSDGSKPSAEALAGALAQIEEPQLALREGRLLIPRLARVRVAQELPGDAIDPDSTVLITGGLSGIGARVARHLAGEHGAGHLLLVSRRGEQAEAAAELRAELEELGAEVSIAACDVSDREQLSALLDSIPGEHPLGAVVHSAAVLEDGVLESQDADRLERVMRPKADAAWHLHELTKHLELSQFLLFSSAAGVLGGAGQTNYAAANAFVDALAHRRRAEGLPATALAWGLWDQESSLGGDLSQEQAEAVGRRILQRFALMPISPERGLQLFDSARSLSLPLIVPVQFDPGALRAQAREGTLPALLRDLVRVPGRRRRKGGSLAARLASVAEADRLSVCRELVRSHAAAVLGHSSAAEIEPDRAFRELGFDSLGAVELRNRLSSASGLRLPATLVFDYPSANALGDFLLAETEVEGPGVSPAVRVRPGSADEPIAIVGMSCRYPGRVSSPQGLWNLANAGVDAIAGFPTDRGWDLERLYDPDPDRPGTCYMREGGFLADAADFDSAFFGISPREAEAMDPQERLLLEACWEAVEDTGIDPVSLRGSQAGVFAGVMYQDYGPSPGMTSSSVTGRVAYSFGLEGPAISVDTACSSSLVAVHLASQALRQGECGMALAGGVAVASTPAMLSFFSRQRGLAPDGRCKSFSDAADGTGFSEGVGVLVLERLSEAKRNGHAVLATIRGSAVNQDGASNGLTAPNGPAQERVIRQALASAGLQAKDVDAVEAHGTGTALGDPIEAGALLATYGQDREAPLKLGSIKSNIGHPQAAAGVAGVIKMVMAMREGVLPRTLHLGEPSSKIEWDAGEIELLTEAAPWQANGHPRRAGVSSFGASGTNAHLILEEAPPPHGDEGGEEPPSSAGGAEEGEGAAGEDRPFTGPMPLVLSAKSEPALRAQAKRLLDHLKDNPELDPADVAYSLATTRSSFEHRGVVVGAERERLLEGLGALASGEQAAAIARGRDRGHPRPVFLFGGQGSQWPRMGLELFEASAPFATRMGECEAALSPHVEWSLQEVLRDTEGKWLDRLDIVQPALFALMVSLARLWEELGVSPGAVVGHSQGEIAAAHIAGALSLDDAALLIARRSQAMTKLAGRGGMLSLSLSPEEAGALLEPFGDRLSLSAINGPASLVVSGDPEALAELQAQCEKDAIRTKPVAVDYAAHSAQIEELREELLEAFAPISPQSTDIPFHSTLRGERIDTAELGPEYWYANLRETVLMEPVLRALLEGGERAFLELSPHPVLSFGLQETIADTLQDEGATVLTSLRREQGGPQRFALSLAQAHASGVELDWSLVFKGAGAKRVPLPTYAFQRRRYWIDSPLGGSDPVAIGQAAADHPFLGAELSLAGGERHLFTGRLSLQAQPWLADHRVHGLAILPAGAFVELALRAGERVDCGLVEDLELRAPLILPEAGALALQVSVAGPDERGRRAIAIHSRPDAGEEGEWALHAEGGLAPRAPQPSPELAELSRRAWPPEGAERLDVELVYERLAEAGVSLGAAFEGLTAAWRRGEEVYAEVSLPPEQAREAQRFGVHPALLDATLHAGMLEAEGAAPQLPSSWAGVSLHASASALRVRLAPAGEEGWSLTAVDETGEAVLSAATVRRRPLEPGDLPVAEEPPPLREGAAMAPKPRRPRRGRGQGPFAARLAAMPEDERRAAALELVRSHAATVLGHASAQEVEPGLSFQELGFDSVGAVELGNGLAAATGLRLPPTLVFDYPTATALAEFLRAELEGEGAGAVTVARPVVSSGEPIAIVGMACRYPGAESPAELWELVASGADAIGGLPADRGWDVERLYHPDPDNPGTTYVREGGFLDRVADFDCGFFGISPREALAIDPQQKLFLEATWEALEDAGIDPGSLRGSPTGVFAGAGFGDYAQVLASRPDGPASSVIVGASSGVVAGRTSYTFGFEGPTMSVDTACSSSLVATHLAIQALRQGECSLALAGGVMVMATPSTLIDLNAQRSLARDGRCKAFADAADGTGVSEGVGTLLLERLSDAERNGHPVQAVVRGSAVNQDGASNGLTAPNGPSQERVILTALASAGLEPRDIDVVEAHGTGTPLGDPIEAGALLAAYGRDREAPLKLGSVKSNIGHPAAAAGVAGVIKMVMAIREGVLPRTLHAERPSANIDWDAGAIELLTEQLPWERNGSPRRAGVSSFGVSGTNAHLILEEPASPAPAPSADVAGEGGPATPLPGSVPLLLSAKSEEALRDSARRLSARLEESPELDPVDVAYSLATTRAGLPERAVALGEDREQLLASLAGIAQGAGGLRVARGKARAEQRPVFLFPGYGSQWPGMALELLESSPVFAQRMGECVEALEPYLDWSVMDVLRADGAPELNRSDIGSLALFATAVSLAGLWRACGVEPAAAAGHSQGELVAAHVAGGLSLDDAARVAALRNRALSKLAGRGMMVSVPLSAERLASRLERWAGRISVAAINGPSVTVVSGDSEPLDELIEQCLAEGVRAKRVPGIVVASHSPQVEALHEEMLESLAPISPRSGEIPFYSTVTGEQFDTAGLDAEYWYRNARETVRLEPVVRRLIEGGNRLLLEISPHPVLRVGLEETADLATGPGSVELLATLRRDEGSAERFALSLAEAHVAGARVDWPAFFAGTAAKRVELPTYPFERRRCWASASAPASDPTAIGQAPAEHPLLGATIESLDGESLMLTGRVSRSTHPWLADYAVAGNVVLPGAAFVELALKAGREVGAETIDELKLEAPLVLPDSEAVQLRVSVGPSDEGGRREIAVHSRPEGAPDDREKQAWSHNAAGVLSSRPTEADSRPGEGDRAWPPEGAEPLDADLLYERLAEAGLDCGPSFRAVRAVWSRGEELFAEVSLTEEQRRDAARFGLHPALLDAAAHAGIDRESSRGGGGARAAAALPVAWRGVRLSSTGASAARVRIGPNGEEMSLAVLDESGAAVFSIDSVGSQPLDPERLRAARRSRSLYRVEWSAPARRPGGEGGGLTAILGEVEAPGLGAERYADLGALLAAIEAGAAVPEVVLTGALGAPGHGDLPGAAHAATGLALEAAQAWLAASPLEGSRLVFLTERAIAVLPGEDPELASAPLWGLVHSADSENPGRFGLIDVDGEKSSWRALPAALATAEEPRLAIRDGALLAPRLTWAAAAASEPVARPIDPESTVLITGGTSGIGAAVARHLAARHGVRHLLLASRRGAATDGVAELEAELAALGAEATVTACDVADRDQLEALLASIPGEHPLGAVVHSAAALDNGMLVSLDRERLDRVMRPKVDGAWHLHELTKDLDLSQFLLFSSAAGVIGNATQANYAAANVFLDALAAHRQAHGLPGCSMAWGAWALGTGMSVRDLSDADRARFERSGLIPISGEEGLELFDLVRAAGEALLAPLALSTATLAAQAKDGMLPAIMRALVRAPAPHEDGADSPQVRLASVPPAEREAAALDLVIAQLAPILGYASTAEVESDRNLQEMGLDSLGVVELRNRLVATTGLPVPVLALANHPTPAGVAGYLLSASNEGEAGVNGQGGDRSPAAASGTAFVSLLGEAQERGTVEDFVELLGSASRFRPTFGAASPLPEPPRAIRLADGKKSPSLVLIPSVGPTSGPQEYVKLAREFEDRAVFTLPLPGFIAGEALPADLAALTTTLAETIADSEIGADFVLAGHSSGGWIAHALASQLESSGASPAAVVLMDTYDPQDDRLGRLMPLVLAGARQAAAEGSGIDDARLTAMGGYRRLFAAWKPAEVAARTLMVRVGDPTNDQHSDSTEAWYDPIVTVPGDHFSMMAEYAMDTARAVESFLAEEAEYTHAGS